MIRIKYRGHNNYDVKAASDEAIAWTDPGESLTVQSMAEEADLNVLMKRFGVTGKMPENPRVPTYGDFSEVTDYRTALEAVAQAEEGFMELPADVRLKFDNDPQKLLLFAANRDNLPAMREMGLAPKVQENINVSGSQSVQQAGANVGAASGASASGSK